MLTLAHIRAHQAQTIAGLEKKYVPNASALVEKVLASTIIASNCSKNPSRY